MNTDQNSIENIRISKKDDTEVNLYILLDQTNNIVTNAVELELKHLRVTQPQVRVLTMLSREDRPVTLDELANWTLKEFNSVSTLVKRMEKNGLVKKVKKDGDLKTYVILTGKGSDLYHKQVTERSIHLIFGNLSDEEKQQFAGILKNIRDKTRDLLGLDYRPPFYHKSLNRTSKNLVPISRKIDARNQKLLRKPEEVSKSAPFLVLKKVDTMTGKYINFKEWKKRVINSKPQREY